MSTSTAGTITARVTGWDRAVIIALGGAGCALSYDALQQMATAIHVRGHLTYLFPLVIDGFIAYGVRALLVLKDAPLRARLYVWTLFGSATAASIWANALHAVRLNQQAPAGDLRLGDTVVAVLSTIAPLALAGAVHLYILIARHSDRRRWGRGDLATARQPTDGRPAAVAACGEPSTKESDNRPVTGRGLSPGLAGPDSDRRTGQDNTAGRARVPDSGTDDRSARGSGQDKRVPSGPAQPARRSRADAVRRAGQDKSGLAAAGVSRAGHQVTVAPDGPDSNGRDHLAGQSVASSGHTRDVGQGVSPLDRETERLLDIARRAVRTEDKLTRKVVAEAIRGQQIPLSNDTLTALMIHLRRQYGQLVRARRD
ncbi:DUF2637 domain-containing protein [Streptomyces griseoaurantiacus]|uniref:DUF2637 domain-containing protein n=1 Tax=Streptomyces griseoaurantiacus TaxID=68213 RepID=UPI0037AEC3A4